jgi:CobQ/CobB/MinD/ParA nucleotide binding domain
MSGFKHHDEARVDAVAALIAWLSGSPASKAGLIDDLYGKYRLILWPGKEASEEMVESVKGILAGAAGCYWSGQVWVVTAQTSKLDQQVYDGAWEEGRPHPDQPRLRIVDRVRSRVAWFGELADPLWDVRAAPEHKGPPIVVFYSFKGGVGRTTALTSFAIQRARAGERVVVIDGDLDAPGIGPLFAPEKSGLAGTATSANALTIKEGQDDGDEDSAGVASARWGVVDYLLESPSPGDVDLSDYYQSVRNESIVPSNGEILVFAAGRTDENYMAKLARLDFDPARKGAATP